PDEAAQALIDAANEAGGRDNISVVVVEVSGAAEDREVSAPRQGVDDAAPLTPVEPVARPPDETAPEAEEPLAPVDQAGGPARARPASGAPPEPPQAPLGRQVLHALLLLALAALVLWYLSLATAQPAIAPP